MSRLRTCRNERSAALLAPFVGTLVISLAASAGCHRNRDGGVVGPSDSGPFRLTFSLDGSFQGPHGGHPIAIALVRSSDQTVVADGNGNVSAILDPSFTFSSGAVMVRGVTYEVHYWIDSNFGGGSVGVCEPKTIDHQWSVEFLSVSNDVMFTTSYNPGLTEDVCDTFD